ncbi:MAG: hypothetical protein DIU71_11300 [Proteobacteria bacterium]|nr:MAG: hypothetical protein DIU71_11300 [Pseudomonadota bacterium]
MTLNAFIGASGPGAAVATAGLTERPPAPAADSRFTPEYRAQAAAAAEQFESFFIAQMLRQMRSATREIAGEDSIYGQRTAQDMLDMADVALADALAAQRAFGIADVILSQLLPDPVAPPLKNRAPAVASTDHPSAAGPNADGKQV